MRGPRGSTHADVARVLQMVLDGREVDWGEELARSPDLAADLESLRLLSTIADAHRPPVSPSESRSPEARAARPAPHPVSTARATLGRWGTLDLLEKIGEGSQGEIFRAYDPALEVEVALKLLGARSHAGAGEFLSEARRLARVRHPNVLLVHGAAQHGGRVGLWTELLRGRTLEEGLSEQGTLSPHEAAGIGMDLCRALAALHAAGLVHRDLKTTNVMREEGGRVVLMDFGTATEAAAGPGARRGPAAGTPLTMAPEQLRGQRSTAASDLYGLGVVLYRLVSHRYPVEASSIEALMASHTRGELVPLRDRRADLPRPFVEVIERALAIDPKDRFATAGAMERALAACLVPVRSARRSPTARKGGPHPPARAVPSGLPPPSSSFVGRARAMRDCTKVLDRGRLLTLTGLGGVGKTRLALELAAALAHRYADGVWFVDLSALSDDNRVIDAVSTTLGVRRLARKSVLQSLVAHLGDRHLLVVFDNCEQVLAPVRSLVQFLVGSCPRVVVLATSREPLGIAAEPVYQVPPMSLPGRSQPLSLMSARSTEAVRLFLDRARLVQSGFDLTDQNLRSVSDICCRLDGIPLALELAATQLRLLSPQEISAMLKDRFRLLQAPGATPPRHHTLRAALDWSHDLLRADERNLFRSLSVFSRGWTLAAAAAVCREDRDEFALLEVLSRLVDKSLVVVERRDQEISRYHLLDTVHEFAAEQLDRTRQRATLEERHIDFYLAMAESTEPELGIEETRQGTARLQADHGNLLAALDRCASSPSRAIWGLRLAGALARFWSVCGLFELGRRELARALGARASKGDLPHRAKALTGAGDLAAIQDDIVEARRSFTDALRAAESLQDQERMASALSGLSHVAVNEGDFPTARTFSERSLALRRVIGEPRKVAVALNNLGAVLWRQGDLAAARPTVAEALVVARRQGDSYALRLALINHEMLNILPGGPRSSGAQIAECLQLILEQGAKRDAPAALEVSASLAALREQSEIAARLYGAAETLRHALGVPSDEAWRAAHAPHLAGVRHRLGSSVFANEWANGGGLSLESAIQEAFAALGPSEERREPQG